MDIKDQADRLVEESRREHDLREFLARRRMQMVAFPLLLLVCVGVIYVTYTSGHVFASAFYCILGAGVIFKSFMLFRLGPEEYLLKTRKPADRRSQSSIVTALIIIAITVFLLIR